MAGLWNATSVLTRRTITPSPDQSRQISSTAATAPDTTVDTGDALMAATTSVRPCSRRSASSNGRRTKAIAPRPITVRNPRAR